MRLSLSFKKELSKEGTKMPTEGLESSMVKSRNGHPFKSESVKQLEKLFLFKLFITFKMHDGSKKRSSG